MGEIIGGAFNDAFPLMRSRIGVYTVMLALCALVGLALPLTPNVIPESMAANMPPARLMMALYAPILVGAIAVFFILPAVIRTARPEFRMTLGRIFGVIGLRYGVGVGVALGFILFVIPGFWFAIRWSQYIWTFLLSEGKDPLDESWEITEGQYWPTFGFLILIGICAAIPFVIVMLGAAALAGFVAPQLGVVLLPISFLGFLYSIHVALIGGMRWALRLRERAHALATAGP